MKILLIEMKLSFYGGVGGLVTGANYFLEDQGLKMLIDCGLSQGSHYAELLNYEKFDYPPAEIKYVFITHSHVDHIGRLPKLYKDGFRGTVYATTATRDMMFAAFPDTWNRLAEDAKQNGRESIYAMEDVNKVMALVSGVEYDSPIDLVNGIKAIFHDAGHILGSSIVEIDYKRGDGAAGKIFFSGDLGNPPTPLLRPTEFVDDADYVVVESAYGDRVHEDRSQRKEKLKNVIKDTASRGGTLMIPSFALERTQELLFELNEMINAKSIPEIPVFIDSPLAIKMVEVYEKYPDYFNKHANYLIDSGDDIFKFPMLKFTDTVDESKSINNVSPPKIIIAGSGMSNGGRILHHELRYLPDPNSTILFVGYQVSGSLGRRILDGEKEVKIFGQTVPVRCHIRAIGGYSAHADQPGILRWLNEAKKGGSLKKVFIVQGEEKAARTLADHIGQELKIEAVLPKPKETFEI